MPTNKNALIRIVLLDKLLADRYHAYSIQDMTDYLERELPQYGPAVGVSKRCIEKDIEYLEYNFPILIELERYTVDAHSRTTGKAYKKHCIRYADPAFSIFKGKLTDEEKGLLTNALSTIGAFDGLDGFGGLDDLTKHLGLIKQRPLIQMSKNLFENKTLMAELFSMIQAKSVVKIKYRIFNAPDIREVVLSPYLLKEYNCRWYVIGGAYDTGRILNFALDRVESVSILPGYTYHDAPDNLFDRFEDIIGISYYEGSELHKIIFWVSDTSLPFIETKPLHGSQTPIRGCQATALCEKFNLPSAGAFFSIECMTNYELIRELCSFGGELKVLSPEQIVNAIKHRVKSAYDLYF